MVSTSARTGDPTSEDHHRYRQALARLEALDNRKSRYQAPECLLRFLQTL